MMYYCAMTPEESTISVKALKWALEKKKWKPITLSKKSGVNKGTISLLLDGKVPGVSANVVAKLARALEVTMDFLMGLTDNPEQKAEMDLAIAEIIAIAKTLSEFRQRDLLLVAKAYQDASDPTAEMMQQVYEEVEKIAGEDMRKKLHASIESLRRTRAASPRRRRDGRTGQQGNQKTQSE